MVTKEFYMENNKTDKNNLEIREEGLFKKLHQSKKDSSAFYILDLM